MINIKHIFFDLDHTLWDFERNSALVFQQIFKEEKIELEIEEFLKVYKPINFEYWKLYREERISKEKLRYGRLSDTFKKLNLTISDSLIDVISENYISYLPNYNYLIDGTLELLEYLKDKYQMHIITNGFEEIQDLKLEKSGIKKYFKEIVTSESVGVKKPNPRVFEFALKIAGASKEQSIMIGDSLEADVYGALDFGIDAIYFNESVSIKSLDLNAVNSLKEIKQFL